MGPWAHGCAGFGLGFRADPNPFANCTARVAHGVAVALLPDRLEVVRTDIDFGQPMRTAYYPWLSRLDDGAVHRARVTSDLALPPLLTP